MEWDLIVVGAGTAGCVVASRLSERPGRRVLLLEAGGEFPRLRLSAPLPSLREITRFSWKHFTSQQPCMGWRRISLPMGRVMGGSSSVNAMMYCRGAAADYDRWSDSGANGWSYRELLPYFVKLENCERADSDSRGRSGPVRVSRPRHRAPFSEAFIDACEQTIAPPSSRARDRMLGPDAAQEGAGYFELTQKRGLRVTTALAYLKRARRRPGLTVVSNAAARRLLFERNRARGVEYSRDGAVEIASASEGVVLCAGAIGSPQLLLLSGVGPSSDLRALGIRTALDLPGVGRNLHDHVRVPVLYESLRASPGDMPFWAPAMIEFLALRRGVMASNCCEAGAYVRSSPEAPSPDIQFVTHFQSALYPSTVDLQYCLMDVESRGKIGLRSCDPAQPPVIDPAYLTAPADIKKLIRGMRLARRVAAAQPLRRFPLGREIMPGPDIETDGEIAAYIRAAAETCYHPAGTCKMGRDPMAVVDERLRVRGLDGLRIADASVMPYPIAGNTFAPTVMIAEKAAEMIDQDATGRGNVASPRPVPLT